MKFKVGDKVKLSPRSKWVNLTSAEPDSDNPLDVVGEILDICYGSEYRIRWGNGHKNAAYTDECLLPVCDTQELYAQRVEELGAEVNGAGLEKVAALLNKNTIKLSGFYFHKHHIDDLCIYLQYLKGKME